MESGGDFPANFAGSGLKSLGLVRLNPMGFVHAVSRESPCGLPPSPLRGTSPALRGKGSTTGGAGTLPLCRRGCGQCALARSGCLSALTCGDWTPAFAGGTAQGARFLSSHTPKAPRCFPRIWMSATFTVSFRTCVLRQTQDERAGRNPGAASAGARRSWFPALRFAAAGMTAAR